MRWSLVGAGYALLLLASYLDNTRGPALPVITAELRLDFGLNGLFLTTGYAAAALALLGALPLLARTSERTSATAVSLFAVGVGVAASFVDDTGSLLGMAALLGASTALMGALCNVLVVEGTPLPLQPRMLSGLHAVYGLSSMLAAQVVAATLVLDLHWSTLYTATLPIFLLFAVVCWWGLPAQAQGEGGAQAPAPVGVPRGLEVLVIVLFGIYVGGEVTASMWLPSYLVQVEALTVPEAADHASGFFFVMMASRLVCFALATPRNEAALIAAALVAPLLCFGAGYGLGWTWAFAGMGLLGPFFPLMMSRLRRLFPERWRLVVLWQMTFVHVVLGVLNMALGGLADAAGMGRAYLLPPAMLLLAAALFAALLLLTARRSSGRARRAEGRA